jgi:hypothetical protein
MPILNSITEIDTYLIKLIRGNYLPSGLTTENDIYKMSESLRVL